MPALPADRVFGPAATTRAVYDLAAHPVVAASMDGINGEHTTGPGGTGLDAAILLEGGLRSYAPPRSARLMCRLLALQHLVAGRSGSMEGLWCCSVIAGTVFAYGVTSSGKTHTMHVSPCTAPQDHAQQWGPRRKPPDGQLLLLVPLFQGGTGQWTAEPRNRKKQGLSRLLILCALCTGAIWGCPGGPEGAWDHPSGCQGSVQHHPGGEGDCSLRAHYSWIASASSPGGPSFPQRAGTLRVRRGLHAGLLHPPADLACQGRNHESGRVLLLLVPMQTPGREFLLRVSYLEIYNEVSRG